MRAPDAPDVLIVSLGSTGGLRRTDEELEESLRRAGESVVMARARPPAEVPTLMLTDLLWARAARAAASAALGRLRASPPRVVVYSTTTAALLWPRPGAIRFDAPASGNRRGRHGLWQRPLERRRLAQAKLLIPQSDGALAEAPAQARRGVRPAIRRARHRRDHLRGQPRQEGPRPRARSLAARAGGTPAPIRRGAARGGCLGARAPARRGGRR